MKIMDVGVGVVEYKGYQIKPSKEAPKSYVIVTSGRGGKIPDVMSGLFTSPNLAMQIVDTYTDSKGQDSGQEIRKGRV
jgi:NCAIR mutase (PurE)-related protein